jgi:hypothetical protein
MKTLSFLLYCYHHILFFHPFNVFCFLFLEYCSALLDLSQGLFGLCPHCAKPKFGHGRNPDMAKFRQYKIIGAK